MNALTKLTRKRYALFKSLVPLLLVLSLTACGGKAVSQDVSISLPEQPIRQKNAQLSSKISEVAPPEVIRELNSALEIYQPQVKILKPQPNQVLETDKLEVSLEVKDLPIFKNSQYGLGNHLKVILDKEPGLEVYDLDTPLELSDLSPGTHTLRVFAVRPWYESFKNEGAYAQTTFHVFAESDDNNPDSNLPILTYNVPSGTYGAEPILLDFYLTNAPLHILAKDNPDNPIADWRIRCTINDESFILDRWQSAYLKGFNSGQNLVKLEFLDNQGLPVKNVFNSTVSIINYQPDGTDTLAKMIRGELSAEDVRGIVDQKYAVEVPTEVTLEKELEEQPEKEKSQGGFFNRFKRSKEEKQTPQPETNLEETTPEVIETPQPEANLEETTPEVIETPQPEANLEETTTEVIETPKPETNLEETTPEVMEIPQPEATEETIPEVESEETTVEENSAVIETPESTVEEIPPIIEIPAPEVITEEKPEVDEVLNSQEPTVEKTSESTPDLPANQPETSSENQIESKPEVKQSTAKRLGEYFKFPRTKTPETTPKSSTEVEVKEL